MRINQIQIMKRIIYLAAASFFLLTACNSNALTAPAPDSLTKAANLSPCSFIWK